MVYTRRVSRPRQGLLLPAREPEPQDPAHLRAHDDLTPTFSTDGKRVYFSSDEDDDIPNLRSLDLETGVIQQYTDALGGNMAPAVLKGKNADRLAFITYYKTEYRLYAKDSADPMKEVEQEVRSADEGSVDFQADVPHQVIPENKRAKKRFEGMQLEGRPPLNLGVTSSGDFFGGSQVALTDVLGDQNLVITAYSFRELQSYSANYVNLSRRFQYGINLFDQKQFFYSSPYNLQPGFSSEGAYATQRFTGGLVVGSVPLNKFQRLEASAGIYRISESFENQEAQQAAEDAGGRARAVQLFLNNGILVPVAVSLVTETTRFPAVRPAFGHDVFAVGGDRSLRGRLPRPQDPAGGCAGLFPPGLDLDALRGARLRLLFDGRQPGHHLLRRQPGVAGLPVPVASPETRPSSRTSSCACPSSTSRPRRSACWGRCGPPSSRESGEPSTGASSTSSAPATPGSPTSTTPSSASRSRGSTSSTDGPPTASDCRPSCSATPCISTGSKLTDLKVSTRGGSSSSGSGYDF